MSSIILFALIAAFLGLRLFSVLGKKTGHEQSLGQPLEAPPGLRPKMMGEDQETEAPAAAPVEDNPYDDATGQGLRAIRATDPNFSAVDFVEGARGAYEMILNAYWRGKIDEVRPFVSPEVAASFEEAIADRETRGEYLDNRLVAIERVTISSASVDKKVARITVRFDADISAVTRNKRNKMVAGSMSDAVQTHDAWTFERPLKSRDPNWTLVDTDDAE